MVPESQNGWYVAVRGMPVFSFKILVTSAPVEGVAPCRLHRVRYRSPEGDGIHRLALQEAPQYRKLRTKHIAFHRRCQGRPCVSFDPRGAVFQEHAGRRAHGRSRSGAAGRFCLLGAQQS